MDPVNLLGKIIELSQSNLEITARINSALNVVCQDMDFNEALVFTYDKDKKLTCRYTNQKSLFFPHFTMYRCHIGEGVVGSVAQKRMPQYFGFRDVPPRFGCLFYPHIDDLIEKFKAFAFLPVSDDSYLYGVLFVVSATRDTLSAKEKILLSMVSREIGGVLRMNDLIVSTKKRISELATLTELGKALTLSLEPDTIINNIATIVARAFDAVFVTIKLEPSFGRITKERFSYGTIPPALEPRISELESEAKEHDRNACITEILPGEMDDSVEHFLYAAPIHSKETLLGVITIGIKHGHLQQANNGNYPYLLHTMASYISSGLENILLNTRLKNVVTELNEAQKRIIEQEKFRSLGEMTANIAHEIKNPLVIIGGFTKRLSRKLYMDPTDNRYMDIILKEVARLESILNEVLDYVKETPVLFEHCSVNESLDEILELLTSDMSWENVQIVRDYGNSIPTVQCDSQQIKQVFINILLNAYDAIEGKGTIMVHTERAERKEAPFVAVSISDTGGGIDPTIVDNIFNPFFTTKERGTGLGLAISNKIIMNHRGFMEVHNAVGKGVTFVVCLPINNKPTGKELL